MSRIDYIFLTPPLLPHLLDTGFDARVLSDHSPYWITLLLPAPPAVRIWRLNPLWLSTLPGLDVVQTEWEHFFRTNEGSAPVSIIWETFKLHAGMILSMRINRHKASSKLLLRQVEEKLHTLERDFQTDPTPANASLVCMQARLTDQLHIEKAKQGIFFTKQRIFEHGERAGKLLAYIAHLDHKPPVVVSLQTASGDVVTDPDLVAGEFGAFYSSLYSSATNYSQEELSSMAVPGSKSRGTGRPRAANIAGTQDSWPESRFKKRQTPPVRRAAERLSSTRVCQTRVRKSRSPALSIYIVISRDWTRLITWLPSLEAILLATEEEGDTQQKDTFLELPRSKSLSPPSFRRLICTPLAMKCPSDVQRGSPQPAREELLTLQNTAEQLRHTVLQQKKQILNNQEATRELTSKLSHCKNGLEKG
ncbi:hypothetical protein AB205_0131390 [Aquarana catesbeiana]|uniref:Uncharacterized protein n=1 Tax=Aquarana catesbeiana TaxID=8400 RepID=A0A2G9RPF7_AQUCT|nr:hypothetical protein AB205_0131390 [Aquarana catesbeiana]